MEALLRDERFLNRYFTPAETAYVHAKGAGAAQTLAGLYAAKEAVLKAMGVGIALPLQEVEIFHGSGGQPQVRLTGRVAQQLAGMGGGSSGPHSAGVRLPCCLGGCGERCTPDGTNGGFT